MHTVRPRSALLALLTMTAFSGAGCKCSKDHPYVPYTIGSAPSGSALVSADAAPAPPTASSPTPLDVDGGTFPRVIGQQAQPGATTWSLGDLSISAPPGRVFLVGVAMNTPGQPTQVAAFVGDGGSMAGEVVLYRADAGGRVVGPTTLARLPDWLPAGQDCTHMPQLSQIGPLTLWVDVASVCRKNEQTRKPNRYIAALSTAGSPGTRAEFRIADPAPGERLAIDADGADRDNDGTDDLLVQVALEGLPAPLTTSGRVVTNLRFLGRAAGMSRDMQEPGQSLRSLVSWQASQAARKDGAEQALAASQQIRRLHTLLCAESGTAAITLGDGAPINCGEPSLADDARGVEARALMTLGNASAAFAIATQLRENKSKAKRAVDPDTTIEAQSTVRKVNVKPLKVMPTGNSVALPMAFDASGALIVMNEDGIVVSVDPATGQESTSSAGRWNPFAELVGDFKVTDTLDSCKSDFIKLRVKSESSGNREISLPFLGGTAPSCAAQSPLQLIDRNGDGLFALAQGEPVFVTSDGEGAKAVAWPTSPGAGGTVRSPDGHWTAITAPDRVLLRGPGKPELWKPQTRVTLTACTVANDAKTVACQLERGIVILTP